MTPAPDSQLYLGNPVRRWIITTDAEEIIVTAAAYSRRLTGMFVSVYDHSNGAWPLLPHKVIKLLPWPPKKFWRLAITCRPMIEEKGVGELQYLSLRMEEINYDEFKVGEARNLPAAATEKEGGGPDASTGFTGGGSRLGPN